MIENIVNFKVFLSTNFPNLEICTFKNWARGNRKSVNLNARHVNGMTLLKMEKCMY